MSEKVVRRSADITPKEARAALRAKFAGYRIVSFGLNQDGTAYEAKIVKSEFPPAAKGDEDAAPDDEADGPPAPADDGGDDGGDEEASDGPPAPPKGKGKEKGGDHVEHEMLSILKEIATALGVQPAGDPGLPGDVPPPGADPGMAGGDMPPPAAPDPLPPPAKPHGAPMGGGGGLGSPFSKVAAERRSFFVWREPDADGSLPGAKQAVAEITAQLPATHRVAQMVKRVGSIEGGKPTIVYVAAVTAK